MNTQVKDGAWALTEKEKQTLRMIVRGHDAKSIARSLGLSVYTINERLRDARRKMAVSSSREAARQLLAAEGDGPASSNPDLLVDAKIGDDPAGPAMDQEPAPIGGARRAHRSPWILIGVPLMTLALGLLALTLLPQTASAPPATPVVSRTAASAVVDKAREWLALLDQGRWDETYRATTTTFRERNTLQVWTEVSEQARTPLGAMISRTFVSQEYVPAPPHGYEVVKFRTLFANKTETTETVTLSLDDGVWRVAGVTIG